MLDVQLKYLSVNRPFDHNRNPYPIEGQRTNEGNVPAGFEVRLLKDARENYPEWLDEDDEGWMVARRDKKLGKSSISKALVSTMSMSSAPLLPWLENLPGGWRCSSYFSVSPGCGERIRAPAPISSGGSAESP